MSISIFKIKRWFKMLCGNSIEHVNQDKGKCFDSEKIRGYYNNLTEKVSKDLILLTNDSLPTLITENNRNIYFPVAIFQYGLGAYDLFLISKEPQYRRKFQQCVEWTVNNIDKYGRWNNFFFYSPENPYGAMAQGEGASLLIRAYVDSGNHVYLDLAKKALDFMLLPLEDGGTTKYSQSEAYLMEYTFKGMVLNGAIFAWWGLYDYVLITKDKGGYKEALEKILNSLIKILPRFKNTYWSMYSLDGLIASPFYHNLHIAQMEAMYELTRKDIFKECAEKWKKDQKNPLCYSIAFIKKAIQKLLE